MGHRVDQRVFIFSGFVLSLCGCAHLPLSEQDPQRVLGTVCEIGRSNTGVRGSIWMKASSKDASGQFPANVNAQAPDRLTLEVNNLLGGNEALIEVRDKHYTVKAPHHKIRNREGYDSWGGIPLHWSADLFLGRIPCPPSEGAVAKLSEDQLVVETSNTMSQGAQKFVYTFRHWNGRFWPESLHWEQAGTFSAAVDFKFDDPDDTGGSPKKWEAKSSQGEVKVRWGERSVVR